MDCGRQAHLENLIAVAHDYLEQHTARALLYHEREVEITNPDVVVRLPFPPVNEIVAVEFSAADCSTGRECWQQLKWSDYDFNESSLWLRDCCCPLYPCGCCPRLRVRYTCGPKELEPMVLMALCMLVGHWDFNPIATSDLTIKEVPLSLSNLISTLRKRRVLNAGCH